METRPDKSQVAEFRDRLLQWLVSQFEFVGAGSPPGSPGESRMGGSYDRSKALGELGLLWRIVRRFPHLVTSDGFTAIHRHLSVCADAGILSVQQSRSFPHCVRIALALEACATPPELYRPHVVRTFSKAVEDSDQWRTWNFVEVKYYLEALGIDNNVPDFRRLFSCSSLRLRPDISTLKRPDIYEMAHTIFFISDFGRSDARTALGKDFTRTCGYVRALLEHVVDREDWDLVAELLMCCSCLGFRPEPPVTTTAWHGLMATQPRTPVHRSDAPEAKMRSRRERTFTESYHTAIVALIAAVLETQNPSNRAPAHSSWRPDITVPDH